MCGERCAVRGLSTLAKMYSLLCDLGALVRLVVVVAYRVKVQYFESGR